MLLCRGCALLPLNGYMGHAGDYLRACSDAQTAVTTDPSITKGKLAACAGSIYFRKRSCRCLLAHMFLCSLLSQTLV